MLENLINYTNLIALAVILSGGVVRGYTGFGSGLVMVPILAILWGPVDAIVVVLSLGLFSTLQMAYPAFKLVNWRDAGPIVFCAVFVSPIGTYLLLTIDPFVTKKVIAAIVLFFTIISLIGWSYKGPRGVIPSFIAGSISAIINGVAAVGGPAFVLYLMSLPDRAEVQRANMAIITGAMGTSILTYILIGGDVPSINLYRIGILALPHIIAVWIGIKLFGVIPSDKFKDIILWLLVIIVSGILLA